jgi:glutamate-1-semialdehyde 2,1-aminomutase
VTAGLTTLRLLQQGGVYDELERVSARLGDGLAELASAAGVPAVVNRVGSMLTIFFHEGPQVVDWDTASASDAKRFGRYFHEMLARGVYLPPSQYEALFVGLAHTDEVVDRTLEAAAASLRAIA